MILILEVQVRVWGAKMKKQQLILYYFLLTMFLSIPQTFSTFTYSGNTITQSGTDPDLSGLSEIPLDDLVFYYPFEGSSSQRLLDYSLNDRHATEFNGVQYLTSGGPDGSGAYRFDGVNDYLQVPDVVFNGNFTFSAWANFHTTGRNWQRIFDFGRGPNAHNILFAEGGTTGRIALSVRNPATRDWITNYNIPTNTWVHYTFTGEGNDPNLANWRLYVNGVLQDSTATGRLPNLPAGQFLNSNYVGRSNWNFDAYTDGEIDELRIYNRALNASEVLALYNTPPGVVHHCIGTDKPYCTYRIFNKRLEITGDLGINPENEILLFDEFAPYDTLQINSGGELTVGVETTKNGETRNSQGVGVVMTKQGATEDSTAERSFVVNNGGTFNWFGGDIFSASTVHFNNGANINILNGALHSTSTSSKILSSRNIDPSSNISLILSGGFRGEFWSQPNILSLDLQEGISIGSDTQTSLLTFRNIKTSRNIGGRDFTLSNGDGQKIINSELGSDLNVNELSSGTDGGYIEIFKEVDIKVQDFSNQPLEGVKVLFDDINNGNRQNANGQNYLNDISYFYETNSTGEVNTIEVLTAVLNKPNGNPTPAASYWDYRSKNNNNKDIFDVFAWSYNFGGGILADESFLGVGSKELNFFLSPDTSITETNPQIVANYSNININHTTKIVTLNGSHNLLVSSLHPDFNGVYSPISDTSSLSFSNAFNPTGGISVIDTSKPVYKLNGDNKYIWARVGSGYYISEQVDTTRWYFERNSSSFYGDKPTNVQSFGNEWREASGSSTVSLVSNLVNPNLLLNVSCATPNEIYDYASYDKTLQSNIRFPSVGIKFASTSSTKLDLLDYSIVLNDTGICSTEGFNRITTSGNVTFLGESEIGTNVTLVAGNLPANILILSPKGVYIGNQLPSISILLSKEASNLWFNLDGGTNYTLCTNCDEFKGSFLDYFGVPLNTGSYEFNVFSNDSNGNLDTERSIVTIKVGRNHYNNFNDNASFVSSNNVLFFEEPISKVQLNSGETFGSFIGYAAYNLSLEVEGISNISWSEDNTNINRLISKELSFNNGTTWISFNNGLSSDVVIPPLQRGHSILYRINFTSDGSDSFSINDINITWFETSIPIISLIYPINNSKLFVERNVNFTFKVSDEENPNTCELLIDEISYLLSSCSTISPEVIFSITSNLSDGLHNWSIIATDQSLNTVQSQTWFFYTVNKIRIQASKELTYTNSNIFLSTIRIENLINTSVAIRYFDFISNSFIGGSWSPFYSSILSLVNGNSLFWNQNFTQNDNSTITYSIVNSSSNYSIQKAKIFGIE